jgi:isochorismate synthase
MTSSTLQKFRRQFDQQLPFVLYRKPNANHVIGLLQRNQELYTITNFEEKGFVFAPFDGADIVLIPQNKCDVDIMPFELLQQTHNDVQKSESTDALGKEQHIQLVEKAMSQIKQGDCSKIVISRKETLPLVDFDLFDGFQKLAQLYPSAFAYCLYHPKVGLWLGAFSESLLYVNELDFRTMAVAGTQVYDENAIAIWGNKEMEEQKLVTDFLVSNLKDLSANLHVSKPYDLKAGKLIHLKSDIHGIFKTGTDLRKLLSILHPTPAVCGFPKDIAKSFILKNEGYDRSYYSGFLGEFNIDFQSNENATDLFVNLRCVQIETDEMSNTHTAHIYVGGGITAQSNPGSEWLETVNKATTIKKVLL